jgi:hypothetical protein
MTVKSDEIDERVVWHIPPQGGSKTTLPPSAFILP